MKKSLLLLSLAILTIYACTCVSAVSFNPGPLDECGECPNAAPYCIDGVCEIEDPDDPNPGECVPNCENNECGPDGCGDLCGECSEGQLCVSDGPGHTECKEEQDTHSCDGLCTANAGSCWCDLACFEAGDCCEDVCNFCAEDNEEIEKKCQERAS